MSDDMMGALRLDGDRRAVHLERTYATHPEDLWSAITEADRVGRWLARIEGQFQVGCTFVLYFDDDDLDSRSIGQILECRRPERLRVSWYFRY